MFGGLTGLVFVEVALYKYLYTLKCKALAFNWLSKHAHLITLPIHSSPVNICSIQFFRLYSKLAM